MRVITLEEHFTTPLCREATASFTAGQQANAHMQTLQRQQADLGDGRIADMDAAGIPQLAARQRRR